MKALSDELRRLRLERGLGLREVARKLSVSAPYLSLVERGIGSPPTEAMLSRLSDLYMVEVAQLLALSGRLTESTERRLTSLIADGVLTDEELIAAVELRLYAPPLACCGGHKGSPTQHAIRCGQVAPSAKGKP